MNRPTSSGLEAASGRTQQEKPIVIAGPCVAESLDLLVTVTKFMENLARELGFNYVFKASFDKANRTAVDSYRGPGLEACLEWFTELKRRHQVEILTDIHETLQVEPVAQVCDWLQIPAFLCRQTDLIIAAASSGRKINVKKGQFLAPEGTHHIAEKVKAVTQQQRKPFQLALTERGTTFGYGNYIVDMRAFPVMAQTGAQVIFDLTHSVQRTGAGDGSGRVSAGQRQYAPVLARAAIATGYLDGFFLEVHPQPKEAKSDAATVLSFQQTEALLNQLIPLWRSARAWSNVDKLFAEK